MEGNIKKQPTGPAKQKEPVKDIKKAVEELIDGIEYVPYKEVTGILTDIGTEASEMFRLRVPGFFRSVCGAR